MERNFNQENYKADWIELIDGSTYMLNEWELVEENDKMIILVSCDEEVLLKIPVSRLHLVHYKQIK